MIRNEICPSWACYRVWAWHLPAYSSFLIHLAIYKPAKKPPCHAPTPPGFLQSGINSLPCLPWGREWRKLRVHLSGLGGGLEQQAVRPGTTPLRSMLSVPKARSQETCQMTFSAPQPESIPQPRIGPGNAQAISSGLVWLPGTERRR